MSIRSTRITALCKVQPGSRLQLRSLDAAKLPSPAFAALKGASLKDRARTILDEHRLALADAQELLWANHSRSVLVVFQAMDAAGKDGTIKHVMAGLNQQGCEVHGFKRPSDEESEHNFLWRYAQKVPARGRLGIFNRSYYEEVLVVKVHPELLAAQRVPLHGSSKVVWAERYQDINNFEHHLMRNGTLVIKFFLNISKAEQRRRLLDRLASDSTRWKFSVADLQERRHWDAYMSAYQDMLRATSTQWAPWYVIPADHKYVARAAVAQILIERMHALGLEYPKPSRARVLELDRARRHLQKT